MVERNLNRKTTFAKGVSLFRKIQSPTLILKSLITEDMRLSMPANFGQAFVNEFINCL